MASKVTVGGGGGDDAGRVVRSKSPVAKMQQKQLDAIMRDWEKISGSTRAAARLGDPKKLDEAVVGIGKLVDALARLPEAVLKKAQARLGAQPGYKGMAFDYSARRMLEAGGVERYAKERAFLGHSAMRPRNVDYSTGFGAIGVGARSGAGVWSSNLGGGMGSAANARIGGAFSSAWTADAAKGASAAIIASYIAVADAISRGASGVTTAGATMGVGRGLASVARNFGIGVGMSSAHELALSGGGRNPLEGGGGGGGLFSGGIINALKSPIAIPLELVTAAYETYKLINREAMKSVPTLEQLARTGRMLGSGTYATAAGYGGSPTGLYDINERMMRLGITDPSKYLDVAQAYGMPREAGGVIGTSVVASQSRYMAFKTAPEWAAFQQQTAGLGVTSGMLPENAMEMWAAAVESGVSKAIPPEQTFGAITKILSSIERSGVVASPGMISALIQMGQNSAIPGLRTGSVQAGALSEFSEGLKSPYGSPLGMTMFYHSLASATGSTKATAANVHKMLKSLGMDTGFTTTEARQFDLSANIPGMAQMILGRHGQTPFLQAAIYAQGIRHMLTARGVKGADLKAQMANYFELSGMSDEQKTFMYQKYAGGLPGAPGAPFTFTGAAPGTAVDKATFLAAARSHHMGVIVPPPGGPRLTEMNIDEANLGKAREAAGYANVASLNASNEVLDTFIKQIKDVNTGLAGMVDWMGKMGFATPAAGVMPTAMSATNPTSKGVISLGHRPHIPGVLESGIDAWRSGWGTITGGGTAPTGKAVP